MYEILEFLANFQFNYFIRTMGFELGATANMSVVNLKWIRVMYEILEFPTKIQVNLNNQELVVKNWVQWLKN